jgi:hypothetical protein
MSTPAFFATAEIPAAARWARDKVTQHAANEIHLEGRALRVRSWCFQGKFPRKTAEFYGQWDAPESGQQYTCNVRCLGGHFRGQKPTLIVSFTEYTAADGLPLPT